MQRNDHDSLTPCPIKQPLFGPKASLVTMSAIPSYNNKYKAGIHKEHSIEVYTSVNQYINKLGSITFILTNVSSSL